MICEPSRMTKEQCSNHGHEFSLHYKFVFEEEIQVTVILSMIYSNFVNSGVHGHPGQLSTDIDSHIVLLSMEQKAVCQDCQ